MADNKEWSLLKRIKGLNLEEKVFDTEDLKKSEKHEAQIPRFKKELENRGLEIFKVVGHQFITEDGVYIIAHETEVDFK